MKLLLMADGKVGLDIARWLAREYPQDLSLVVTTAKNEIFEAVETQGLSVIEFSSGKQVCDVLKQRGIRADLGLLAWWPHILKAPLLDATAHGFINTHPSLLPHNRGKHYSFWALVEQVPFGASLHFVNEGIDSGDVVAQTSIPYDWEDTGGTLHSKATHEMVELVKKSYPSMRGLNIERVAQNLRDGSFHQATELENASRIDLDKTYRARDLLNMLRAPHVSRGIRLHLRGRQYGDEVRIEIKNGEVRMTPSDPFKADATARSPRKDQTNRWSKRREMDRLGESGEIYPITFPGWAARSSNIRKTSSPCRRSSGACSPISSLKRGSPMAAR